MINQQRLLEHLRGLTLVLLAGAWHIGLFAASFVGLPAPLFLLALGVLFASIVLCWRFPLYWLLFACCFCLFLGMWRYTTAIQHDNPYVLTNYLKQSVSLRGIVVDEPRLHERSRTLIVIVNQLSEDDGQTWHETRGKIIIQLRAIALNDPYIASYGDSLELRGKLQLPFTHSPDIQASMSFPRIMVRDEESNILLKTLYQWRMHLVHILLQTLPQPEASLLVALLLNVRLPELQPLEEALRLTNTTHLISPSGFQITLLTGLLTRGFRYLQPRKGKSPLPAQRLRDWRQWLTGLLSLSCIALYSILCGAGPAVLRAALMGALVVLASRMGRIYNVYTALAFAALLLTLFDPFLLWDIGFLLSFAGTLGLVVLTPVLLWLLRPLRKLPLCTLLQEPLATTFAAQLATLPIQVIPFHQFSLISPLANVLAGPPMGTLMLLGLLISGLGLVFLPFAQICAWLAWPLLWYTDTVIRWCAQLPYASLTLGELPAGLAIPYYMLLLAGIIALRPLTTTAEQPQQRMHQPLWKLLRLVLVAGMLPCIGLLAAFPPARGELTVTFLPVTETTHQGQAILIQTQDNKLALIDGGADPVLLSRELDSRLPFWRHTLDMLLLTTPRREHIAGLQTIVERYHINTVIDAGMLHPDATYALWRRTIDERNLHYQPVSRGTILPLGSLCELHILWPLQELHQGSNEVRDNSLIFRLVTPQFSMLFLGATAMSSYALNQIEEIRDSLQADIVQIVGSATKAFPSALQSVLQIAHPSYLIITPAAQSAREKDVPLIQHPPAGPWYTLQTIQSGTVEIHSSAQGWSCNPG
uniref:DNA internalization-related competence protein ComEC/Rec2 n=1 Tax=Thermosporothrix sp. COM3 TaxID=2490863 RepID=A0A455SUW5_9CHLR|nr:hypothetical protein KTC_57020 [Thermosporothrix sp. COM3]